MSENDTGPEHTDEPWRPESPAPSAGEKPAADRPFPGAAGPGQPVPSPESWGTPKGPAGPGAAGSSESPTVQQPPAAQAPPVPPAGQQPTGQFPAGQPYPFAGQPAPGHPGAGAYPPPPMPPGAQPGYPTAGQPYPAPGHPGPGYSGQGNPGQGYPGSGPVNPAAATPTSGAHPTAPTSGAHEATPTSGYGQPPAAIGYAPAPGYGQPYPTQPSQPRRTVSKVVAGGLLALLLAAGGGVAGGLIVHAADNGNGGSTSSSQTRGATEVLDRSSLASVIAKVKSSVVAITTGTGEGSGIVLNSDGYIVTNNHVVADAGGSVNVNFSDGSTARARVIGTDARTDIGVVKVDNVKNLNPAKFGDSSALQVGDTVIAIGSPLGLEGSVTAGIVSALNRTIDESNGQSNGVSIAGAIQTDAAINPGNSGGALVNLSGEVVGINTAILTSGQGEGNIGVGFAIPGNRANEVAQAIIKGTKVSHPYIGISVGTADGNAGAKVASVVGGSPAEKGGLAVGDVITKAGDKTIHTSDDLLNVVQSAKVGDQLKLTVNRGGSTTTVTVTVGEAPPR